MAKSDLLSGLASMAGEAVKNAAKGSSTSSSSKPAGGLDISSLLTGAVTSAISQNVAKSALGFSDVNGDGKVDLNDILQTIVKAVQGGKVDVKSLSGAITNVWNTAFKAGQDSKK